MKHIYDPLLEQTLKGAHLKKKVPVQIGDHLHKFTRPFPSPADWRKEIIYFLMLDRFCNEKVPPKAPWNVSYGKWQGGTFKGVQSKLSYLQELGITTIWITPVLKSPVNNEWDHTYTGYGAQDFLSIEGRFGSDGSSATAEKELMELVEEVHVRGMYIVVDIVLNHAAEVFDYALNGSTAASFQDPSLMDASFGSEPPIVWMDKDGKPVRDWTNRLPPDGSVSPDDGVWPRDIQRMEFFRRRGNRISDDLQNASYIRGDFDTKRQVVLEYDASDPSQEEVRLQYGVKPVLTIFVRIYQYLISKFDFDGFRIDTVRYVDPAIMESFGNAIREYAVSIGKMNFFTFGEVYGGDERLARFVGRNSSATESYGIDSALDYPLFYRLPAVAKSTLGVEELRKLFSERKDAERQLLCSHGEAGKYFVTFLDNHDQHERFNHPLSKPEQVLLGLALQFTLQGIPGLYYGIEQGLKGTVGADGTPTLDSCESVREALWGKKKAFDTHQAFYLKIRELCLLRRFVPALQYGRLYFREVSVDGVNFGHSYGKGGIVAFSRILAGVEVLVVANTSVGDKFTGHALLDFDTNCHGRNYKMAYNNLSKIGEKDCELLSEVFVVGTSTVKVSQLAALSIVLEPMEVQVWV